MPVQAMPITPAMMRRLSGRPFLVVLDVDGTLAPISPRPDSALVPPETRRVVEALAALPGTTVAVLSGRAATDAAALVGVASAWTIGNHGAELAAPGKPPVARADVTPFADRILAALVRCRDAARDMDGVIVEDKRWTLSVHYRLADPIVVPELIARVEEIARDLGLRVTRGKEVLEVRPPVDVDKGTAAVELAEQLGVLHDGASIFCAGDDRTDEDAFRELRRAFPDAFTVCVCDEAAARDTAAEFRVADPLALRELLEIIVARRIAERASA